MAVHSFSTKPGSEEDVFIDKLKKWCHDNSVNFSSYLLKLLIKGSK